MTPTTAHLVLETIDPATIAIDDPETLKAARRILERFMEPGRIDRHVFVAGDADVYEDDRAYDELFLIAVDRETRVIATLCVEPGGDRPAVSTFAMDTPVGDPFRNAIRRSECPVGVAERLFEHMVLRAAPDGR